MTQRLRGWLIVGGLALALAPVAPAPPAAGQAAVEPPMSTRLLQGFRGQPLGWDLAAIPMSTRLLMAFPLRSAPAPGGFGAPYGSFFPGLPALSSPGPVPIVPAPEPIAVATVTLRPDTALPAVQVSAGTVVTWQNAGDQPRVLVIEPVPLPGSGAWAGSQTGTAAPNGSFSLGFPLPGVYDYYLQDQPSSRARIVVTP